MPDGSGATASDLGSQRPTGEVQRARDVQLHATKSNRALPPSRWVSYDTLFRLFEPYARAEVWQVGPGNLKQLITKWFQGHPVFAGLVPSVWCKRMSEEGRCIYKFSFEYTPR